MAYSAYVSYDYASVRFVGYTSGAYYGYSGYSSGSGGWSSYDTPSTPAPLPAGFSALAYVASNPDLIDTLGTNTAAAEQHYRTNGRAEGRTVTFDANTYLASNTDLIQALGGDATAAARHYIESGHSEGRLNRFNALSYIAANPDLIDAFGTDTALATQQFVNNGWREERSRGFDALSYLASNPDLIQSLGNNEEAAVRHYISSGHNEHRTTRFNAALYLASNPDVLGRIGNDPAAATLHFVQSGSREGRSSMFNAGNYLAANPDLLSALGSDEATATQHYLTMGYREGRRTQPVVPAVVIRDDYAANAATTGTVQVGGSATGVIETQGDVDWFRVDLQTGLRVGLSLSGRATGGGRLTGTYLQVYDSSGRFVTSANGGWSSADAQFDFTPSQAGTYYVAASGTFGSDTGSYTLRVNGRDDYAGTTSTAGELRLGGTTSGRIETGSDADWFGIELTGGMTYAFALSGGAASGALASPSLRLYNSTGTPEWNTSTETVNGAGQTLFTPTRSGRYFVGVSSLGYATGSYTVSASSADDYGNTTATAGRVAVGGSTQGVIERRNDTDWFAVPLVSGTSYRFSMAWNGASNTNQAIPYLSLYSDTESWQTSSGYSGSLGSFSYTPTRTGTYYLAASASVPSGSPALGDYTVTVEPNDDYPANRTTTAQISSARSLTGNLERAGDQDWASVSLTQGRRYVFTATGAIPSSDFDLALYGNSGDTALLTASGGPLTYTPTASGTFYLGMSSRNNATGAYTVAMA